MAPSKAHLAHGGDKMIEMIERICWSLSSGQSIQALAKAFRGGWLRTMLVTVVVGPLNWKNGGSSCRWAWVISQITSPWVLIWMMLFSSQIFMTQLLCKKYRCPQKKILIAIWEFSLSYTKWFVNIKRSSAKEWSESMRGTPIFKSLRRASIARPRSPLALEPAPTPSGFQQKC